MEQTSALAPAFPLSHVRLDFAADLIEESKATVLKDLESAPLIIDAHHFLEGAPPFVIASAGNVDLDLPFELLYALKDNREQLLAMFFERLRLHLEAVAPDSIVHIPLLPGSKFPAAFGLPSVVTYFKAIKAQLKFSANAQTNKAVSDLLDSASPQARAALKGKGKARKPAAAPRSSRAIKPKPLASKLAHAVPPSLVKKSVQTILNSSSTFTIPKKSAFLPQLATAVTEVGERREESSLEESFEVDPCQDPAQLEVCITDSFV